MKESPDYCVVLGDIYKEIRDDVAKLLLVKKKQVNLKVSISKIIYYPSLNEYPLTGFTLLDTLNTFGYNR